MNSNSLTVQAQFPFFRKKPVLAFLLSFLVCTLSGIIDHSFVSQAESLASYHLAPFSFIFGASLLLIIIAGIWTIPGIYIAHFVLDFAFPESNSSTTYYLSFIFSSIVALQALVISKSFYNAAQKQKLSNSQKLIVFLNQTAIVSSFSALMLAVSQSFFTSAQITFPQVASLWSTSLISLITIPSFFYAALRYKTQEKQRSHPIEWFICFSTVVFGIYLAKFSHVGFAFVVIPVLMWSSLRFSQALSTGAILISSILFLTLMESQQIALQHSLPSYVLNLSYLFIIVSTLYFSVLRTDQREIEERLEDIVQQRTQDLLNANQELRDEVFIREQAEQNLLSTSKRYRALIETAGMPIIVLDKKFKIKQWNTAAEIQFAYTKEEVLGKNFIELFIPDSMQDETAWKFIKVLESGLSKESLEGEVISREGLSHTMLWNMTFFSGIDTEDQQNQLLLMGQNISGIRQTQNQLHYLAHYDALTDTANRRLFEDRCAQAIQSAIRHKSEIALIGLDIDHFKRINDTLGHDIGDQFLVTLSKRLKDSVRKEDTIARLGGDEFAILLANVSGREGAEIVARNILKNITQPVHIKGNELIVTSSIGITICPNDGTHYPDLLKNADMAMYRAKKAGRNNIQFYSPEMNNEMRRQHRIEQELRGAISDNQFKLYYQPIIDIETGEVLGLEALLRWHHPQKGVVTPEYFIDIAEQTGQLHDIGQWVIKNACLQGRAIQEWAKGDVQIALNLSNRQFNHPSLVETLASLTKLTRFNPRNLILEMSESTITQNIETSYSTLISLKRLGVSLTIDSFGTGLSSLRQLKQIPVDIIKIDRTFVSGVPLDEGDMAITETLLAIASQMDLRTFATGIETPEQEAFLKINGCRYGQGYLYSPPIPFRKLPDLFKKINSGVALGRGEQIFLPFQVANPSSEEPN